MSFFFTAGKSKSTYETKSFPFSTFCTFIIEERILSNSIWTEFKKTSKVTLKLNWF